jgi:16S rRNA (guanine(966)-N(2))-methyltransferase RsmD
MQKSSKIRPTTDKVRSAIFSIIADKIKNANILDLFAGTGAFGIESLSRGAAKSTFIDINITSLIQNTKFLNKENYTIKKSDALRIIRKFNEKFDIIFIDPPYGQYDSNKILNEIYTNKIIANDGFLIYEESVRTNFTYDDNIFEQFDFRKYGETVIYLLRKI